MKRILATLTIFVITAGSIACGGKTTKEKLAFFTANTDAGVMAFVEATKRLKDGNRLSGAAEARNYAVAQKVTDSIDIIRDRARTGWSKQDALTVIDDLISDINRAETESIINLDAKSSESFKKVTFFTQFSLRSLKAIIEASKEPTVPAEELNRALKDAQTARPRANETIWTDIVLILQDAILRGISQSRMSVDEAFADGEALHALITEKIAAYTGK